MMGLWLVNDGCEQKEKKEKWSGLIRKSQSVALLVSE